ncbi:MAG TPA: MgtC/SapB family protein [Burkholderiaceae bacterium]|nr:MgtC/SapB family protein [Burkholderiaceae bacterium]
MSAEEFALRVLVATLCGVLLGYERAQSHKNTGMRTLGLVGLGAGLLPAALQHAGASYDSTARVIQGLLAGIGFLGAGVILHGRGDDRPHGLTTAAAVWITSILGVVAGIGQIGPALAVAVLAFVILWLGARVDRAIEARSADKPARRARAPDPRDRD